MTMTTEEAQSRQLFEELKPGDRVEVLHTITVGNKQWQTVTEGSVVRTERRRQGLHFRRNHDDKVFSDMLLLRLDDGETTTAVMDEFTVLRRV